MVLCRRSSTNYMVSLLHNPSLSCFILHRAWTRPLSHSGSSLVTRVAFSRVQTGFPFFGSTYTWSKPCIICCVYGLVDYTVALYSTCWHLVFCLLLMFILQSSLPLRFTNSTTARLPPLILPYFSTLWHFSSNLTDAIIVYSRPSS